MRGFTSLRAAPRARTCASWPAIPGRLVRFASSATSYDGPPTLSALRDQMLARPTTAIFDNLTPTPSHLLTITLSDFLPKKCWPADFDAGRPRLPPAAGSTAVLPQGHHLVYFAPQLAGSQLMADGTDPAHSPGKPWSRRMWAGGSLSFAKGWEEKLKLDGRRAVCVESIGDVSVRGKGVETRRGIGDEQMLNGREKVFVDVVRKYGAVEGAHASEEDGARSAAKDDLRAMTGAKYDPAIEEVRTLVFMAEKSLGASQILRAPYKPTFYFGLNPTTSLLFHYSALTFNAHAIHLDPQYSRKVEGLRNLLVHGPLSLTLMLAALRSQLGPGEYVKRIDYRNVAPLFAGEYMTVCVAPRKYAAVGQGAKWDVWVEGPKRGLAVKAIATT